MITSLIGIMGNRLVSVLSLVVTICDFLGDMPLRRNSIASAWRDFGDYSHVAVRQMDRAFRVKRAARNGAAGLARLLEHSHIDLLREHHLLGDYEFAHLLKGREIVHQVQHQIF